MALASLLAHGAVMALLLRAPTLPPPGPDLGPIVVSLYDSRDFGALSEPQTKPLKRSSTGVLKATAEPPQPSDIQPQYVDIPAPDSDIGDLDAEQDPVALSVSAAASGASAETCQLTQWLQQALQADPQVQGALMTIPRRARSLSNALMLWDGGWIDGQPRDTEAVAVIRAAVVSGVRSAPEACRTQLVRGPELMTLTNGLDTTVVAIGSGEWRWGDLLIDRLSVTLATGLSLAP